MNKTNDTSRELTSDELDSVSGGNGRHFDDAVIDLDVGGGGGGTTTPAGAWNDCLKVFGYPAQA